MQDPAGGPFSAWLRSRRGTILHQWQEAARRLPSARELSSEEFRDHLPPLLDRVIEMVATSESGREPKAPFDDAERHAASRLGEGFDLGEMVQEYALLRSCILRLWEQSRSADASMSVLIAFNAAMDRAIATSVERFAEARYGTMHALDRVAAAALEAPDLRSLLGRLLQVFVETSASVDTSAILLREGDRLYARAVVGLKENFSLRIGEGFAGRIALERQPRESRNASKDPLVKHHLLRAQGVRALYGVPLVDGGTLVGVAHMGSCSFQEFSESDKRIFRLMAARASGAIQLHRLRDEALAKAQELRQLDQLISVHPDFFYLVDRAHRITYASPSLLALWGRSIEESRGRTFADLGYPSELVELHRRQFERAIDGETVRGENAYTSPRGHTGHYESIFTPVFGDDGRVEAVAGVTRDVTERKRYEEELLDTATLRERLIGTLGHDLRTPLSAIKLGIQQLILRGGLSEDRLQVLKRVEHGADRMERIVRDIVDYARSGRGRPIPVAPRRVDLTRLCAGLLDELALSYPGRPIAWEGADPIEGRWDPDRVSQAVTNLLTNALDHGAQERPVALRVGGDEQEATVEVHNWGPPIPEEKLRYIFEPYERLAGRGQGGLGLGLHIVSEIVSAHRGRVQVSSTEREGTLFRIVLPRA